MDEAIAYTRIPAGTFRKWVAIGRIPAHGGRRKLFHRDERDDALGHSSGDLRPLRVVADRPWRRTMTPREPPPVVQPRGGT